MPSDHETASREQRVEALAKVIVEAEQEFPHVSTYAELAEAVVASDWLRDLLAEAKAEALREAADALDEKPEAMWRQGTIAFWLRDRAANPYRETSKERADD